MSFDNFLKGLGFKPKIMQILPRSNERLSEITVLNERLDAMIVMPARREGYAVLDSLYAAATQVKKDGWKFVHGITLILNKKTDSGERDEEDRRENFKTLKLLYYLRYGEYIFEKGELTLEQRKMAMKIRETGVPIYVVDASTDSYTTQDMTIGMARRISTELSVNLLEDEGSLIVGTDSGDTVLGPHTLATLKEKLETSTVQAGPLRWVTNLNGLSVEESRAYLVLDIYYFIKDILLKVSSLLSCFKVDINPSGEAVVTEWRQGTSTGSLIRSSVMDMPGGGSFYTVEAYRKSGGHKIEQSYHEDTDLIFDMLSNGVVLRDLRKVAPEAFFLTKARISDRPSDGFGSLISRFNPKSDRFSDVKVPGTESVICEDFILEVISELVYFTSGNMQYKISILEKRLREKKMFKDAEIKGILDLFILMDGKDNSLGHHRLIEYVRKLTEHKFEYMKLGDMTQDVKILLDQVCVFFEAVRKYRIGEKKINIPKSEEVASFFSKHLEDLTCFNEPGSDGEAYRKSFELNAHYRNLRALENNLLIFSLFDSYLRDTFLSVGERFALQNVFKIFIDESNARSELLQYRQLIVFLKQSLTNLSYSLTESDKIIIKQKIKQLGVAYGNIKIKLDRLISSQKKSIAECLNRYPNFFKINHIYRFLGIEIS